MFAKFVLYDGVLAAKTEYVINLWRDIISGYLLCRNQLTKLIF